jgi:hypothetical protein
MNYKPILAGALTGLAAAVKTDFDAWKKAPADSKFDWTLALKRWFAGAVTGAFAGAGLGSVSI